MLISQTLKYLFTSNYGKFIMAIHQMQMLSF